MDKENVHTVMKSTRKLSERKNDSGKKKGLSLNVEKRAVCTPTVRSSSVGKAKFQIYSDDSDGSGRSRSRVRKNVSRKEIGAGRENKAAEKAIAVTTKVAEANYPASRVVSRRTRSSSGCRYKAPLNKMTKLNSNNLFHNRRASSDSRKISSQHPQSSDVQSSDLRKTKHLTDDVKKRTFSSIQMWKDKMRKPSTVTMPKNIAANVNVNNKTLLPIDFDVDKTNAKTNLRKNSATGSMDLKPEIVKTILQNCTKNENVKKPTPKADSLNAILKYFTNEVAAILEDKSPLTEDDANTESSTSKETHDDSLSTTIVGFDSTTPLDGPSSLPLTPTKVRYEKRTMAQKLSNKKEYDLICDIICETPYERDYLDEIPDTERKRDDNALRLSPCFLHENVNAEQRRLVVGYIIRLGVHCHYSSHIVYQTVKLFNVAIDRILVETNDIQMMALTCLWIILKQEAPGDKIPSATAVLKLAKDLYVKQEKLLLMYEKKVLSAVKFNIRFADPFSLFSYYILNVNQDCRHNIVKPSDIVRVYFCGSYMIDLSMLDEYLCDIPACVIAIAAVELSLRFVYSSDVNVDQAWCQVWRNMQSLTEWEERMMNSTKRIMIQRALKRDNFSSTVIYKKYTHSRYGRVTNFLHDKLKSHIPI